MSLISKLTSKINEDASFLKNALITIDTLLTMNYSFKRSEITDLLYTNFQMDLVNIFIHHKYDGFIVQDAYHMSILDTVYDFSYGNIEDTVVAFFTTYPIFIR